MHQFSLIVYICCVYFVLAAGPDNCALNEHDRNVICFEAVNCNGFCAAVGEADAGCKTMSEKVKGENPKCVSPNICSFTKDGKPAYIASKKDLPGVTVVKECRKGVSIVTGAGSGETGGANIPNNPNGNNPNSPTGASSPSGSNGPNAPSGSGSPSNNPNSPSGSGSPSGSPNSSSGSGSPSGNPNSSSGSGRPSGNPNSSSGSGSPSGSPNPSSESGSPSGSPNSSSGSGSPNSSSGSGSPSGSPNGSPNSPNGFTTECPPTSGSLGAIPPARR